MERDKRIGEIKRRIDRKRKRKFKITFFLILFFLVIYFIYFLRVKTLNFLWNYEIFKLKKIEIYPENMRHLITGFIEMERDKNLLFLDIDSLRAKIMALPEIENCKILKVYPYTLQINIILRKPWAYIIDGTQKYVIDKDGVILPFSNNENLLIIKGIKVKENIRKIEQISKIEILNEIEKWYNHFNIGNFLKIKEVDISDLNKIIISDGEKMVFLSSEDIKGKMENLKNIFKKIRNDFEYIDTRFKNFYIKFKNE